MTAPLAASSVSSFPGATPAGTNRRAPSGVMFNDWGVSGSGHVAVIVPAVASITFTDGGSSMAMKSLDPSEERATPTGDA
jgi:hypothetical protein